MSHLMHEDVERILFTPETLRQRVRQLGEDITRDFAGKELLAVGILKGAVVFYADLLRQIDLPVQMDFMACSSYGAGTQTTGTVRINKDLDHDIAGRHVLLVEDILDTGLTLSYLKRLLEGRKPPRSRSARSWTRPSAGCATSMPTTWALKSPTPLWWAMAWTMTAATATCPMWACSNPKSMADDDCALIANVL